MTFAREIPDLHDVLIVGAGPSALAVAARLREHTPSALFSDEEHRRFQFLRGKRASKPPTLDTLVLDADGPRWMSRWNRLFDAFKIEHLRSPMFFHPDPSDRDALKAFTYEQSRQHEVEEICNVVGREKSKHMQRKLRKKGCSCVVKSVNERERDDYFTPSAALFKDFCSNLLARYDLDMKDNIRHERVTEIVYEVVDSVDTMAKIFAVTTDTATHYARTVVLAVGAGNAPAIPRPFPQICEGASHALQARGSSLLPQKIRRRIAAGYCANVMVIGGGLTSAQVVDLSIKEGACHVWHIMRGNMRVKPFDVDLNWMGKFRNHEKSAFWMADSDQERAEMLKNARGGGSITPRFAKILQTHTRTGRLSTWTDTSVASATYDVAAETWQIVCEPSIPALPKIDHVVFATGVQSDITTLPYLQSLSLHHPIGCIDGLPALTDDLAWSDDVPLFVNGKLAGLRLGPGAADLEGARAGAERIAYALGQLFARDDTREMGYRDAYIKGLRGRYDVLQGMCSEQ